MNNVFATRLRQAMIQSGLNQTELSKKSGVDRSLISHYLKAEYKAKQDKVDALASALGVPEWWLMGFDLQEKAERISPADFMAEVTSLLDKTEGMSDREKEKILNDINFICGGDN